MKRVNLLSEGETEAVRNWTCGHYRQTPPICHPLKSKSRLAYREKSGGESGCYYIQTNNNYSFGTGKKNLEKINCYRIDRKSNLKSPTTHCNNVFKIFCILETKSSLHFQMQNLSYLSKAILQFRVGVMIKACKLINFHFLSSKQYSFLLYSVTDFKEHDEYRTFFMLHFVL